MLGMVHIHSSPVREREREREKERERERESERCRICPELLFLIFKRNDGCLGTLQLSSLKK